MSHNRQPKLIENEGPSNEEQIEKDNSSERNRFDCEGTLEHILFRLIHRIRNFLFLFRNAH